MRNASNEISGIDARRIELLADIPAFQTQRPQRRKGSNGLRPLRESVDDSIDAVS